MARLQSHDDSAGGNNPKSKTAPGTSAKKPAPTSKKAAKPKTKSTVGATAAALKKKPAQKKAPKATPKKKAPQMTGPADPEDDTEDLELTSSAAVAESNIRVDVRVLDHLMNLVGELVLARNQLVQHLASSQDSHLVSTSQRLDSITSELQEAVMRTRMQPISSIWRKLPRFTRDLALSFGKEVEFEMEGENTDLDKSVIEAIKGSLLHLVRNSVDHGIEPPDVREAKGKPRAGKLRLRAHHEGGNVVIEVRDDGNGLDHERIIDRAIKAGLVSEEASAGMSQAAIECTHIPTRIFHRLQGDQYFRAGCRPRRGPHQCRKLGRIGRAAERTRPVDDISGQDPTHPRHRLGPAGSRG